MVTTCFLFVKSNGVTTLYRMVLGSIISLFKEMSFESDLRERKYLLSEAFSVDKT